MYRNKSQTATEYLVIITVVIIIALIVVTTLGGIPGIGGSTSEKVARATLASATISISDYGVSDYDTVFTLRNNHNNFVEIDAIVINGEECHFFYGENPKLQSGQSEQIICEDVFELDDTTVSWPIIINWTDTVTSASYSQDTDDFLLVGSVGTKYLATLQSNAYWNAGQNGCYNDTVSPIPVCTCVDLNRVRDNLTYNHTLQNSIDFNRCFDEFNVDYVSGEGWDPIGNSTSAATAYNGTFDGQSNIVKSLTIERSADRQGLFGDIVTSGSTAGDVKNLGLVAVAVDGDANVGGLVGYGSYTNYTRVFVSGSVNGSGRVGGLVGDGLYSNYTKAYAIGSVTASSGSSVGGLVGAGSSSVIRDTYSVSLVTGTTRSGGLIGDGDSSSIVDSYAQGVVNGTQQVGGLVGLASKHKCLKQLYNCSNILYRWIWSNLWRYVRLSFR